MCGARDRVALQGADKAAVRHLGIHCSIGIWVVLIKITSSSNGMVRCVVRATIDLMWPSIQGHLIAHVCQCLYLGGSGSKDIGAGIVVCTEQRSMQVLSIAGTHYSPDILVPCSVLGGPKPGLLQSLGHVLSMGYSRRLLQHPQCTFIKRRARCEAVVVHNHPLTAVGACCTLPHQVCPLLATACQTTGHHYPHEVWNLLSWIALKLVVGLICEHRYGGFRHHKS
mmetsp:Transcript_25139/g.58383  ORF Transcript_25139/g.58383 Transcript_25139/m.58383 type:complete len:225 (+) Transcript_25139:214-888(+)